MNTTIKSSPVIRLAIADDLPAIDRIYNQAVEKGFCTAHTRPMSRQERMDWFARHPGEEYPVYVYEDQGQVAGWLSLSAYRPGREALDEVAELSFYVDFDHHGRGIASALTDHCLGHAAMLNKRVLFAIIIEGNEGSIRVLQKFGFERWGYLPEVIRYDGETRGQVYMGRVLSDE